MLPLSQICIPHSFSHAFSDVNEFALLRDTWDLRPKAKQCHAICLWPGRPLVARDVPMLRADCRCSVSIKGMRLFFSIDTGGRLKGTRQLSYPSSGSSYAATNGLAELLACFLYFKNRSVLFLVAPRAPLID